MRGSTSASAAAPDVESGEPSTCSSCGHPLGAQARDWLTGLQDRGTWQEQASHVLDEGIARGQPVALLIADLDWFKEINDGHGHRAGDDALRTVAAILRAESRDGDLVARYGGDEFLALLPATGVAGALTMARRVSRGVHSATVTTLSAQDGQETTLAGLTVSMGLAVSPRHIHNGNITVDGLLLAADGALLAAKRNGRGQSVLALPPERSGGQRRWTFDRVVQPQPHELGRVPVPRGAPRQPGARSSTW